MREGKENVEEYGVCKGGREASGEGKDGDTGGVKTGVITCRVERKGRKGRVVCI